jgi:hypothetical protein
MALCHSIVAKIHNSKLPKFLGSNEGMQVYWVSKGYHQLSAFPRYPKGQVPLYKETQDLPIYLI